MIPTLASIEPAPIATRASSDPALLRLWLARQNSVKGLAAYERIALAFLAGVPDGLRSARLDDLVAYAGTIRHLADATQRTHINILKSLLTFAHDVGYTPLNVGRAYRAPREIETRGQRILSEADVIRLIDATAPRHRLMVRLMYAGGLRVAEVCALTGADVIGRDQGAQVSALGKGRKRREILIPHPLAGDLIALRTGSNSPVFPGRSGALHVNTVWAAVKAAARRAGLSDRVSPHFLRHAHASHALDRGAPISLVQQTLGHASVATTSGYLHARPDSSSATYLSSV